MAKEITSLQFSAVYVILSDNGLCNEITVKNMAFCHNQSKLHKYATASYYQYQIIPVPAVSRRAWYNLKVTSDAVGPDPEELPYDGDDDRDAGHGGEQHARHGHRRPRRQRAPPRPPPARVRRELGVAPPLGRRLDGRRGHERRRELEGAPGPPGRGREAEARRAREEDGGERPAEERGAGAEEGRVRRGGARARDAGGEEELRVERWRVGRVGQDVGQGLGPLSPRGSGSGSGEPSLDTGLGLRHAGCGWGTAAEARRRGRRAKGTRAPEAFADRIKLGQFFFGRKKSRPIRSSELGTQFVRQTLYFLRAKKEKETLY